MLIPLNSLREIEQYKRRVRAPRHAIRDAYAPIHRAVLTLTPRHFNLEGPCRSWEVASSLHSLLSGLRQGAVFSLDSALELVGSRRWTTDSTVTCYVFDWRCAEDLLSGGVLRELGSGSRALVLHACLPDSAPEETLTASGFRVTAPKRLAEELLGFHGARLDLFARIVDEAFFAGVLR